MTSPNILKRLTALAALVATAAAAPAQDRGTQIFFGVGEKVVHVAPLTADMRAALGPAYGPEFALGFRYGTLALFGLDLWTWDGGYCIYAGPICDRVSATRSAEVLGVGERDLRAPWSYTFRPGLITAVLVGGLLYAFTRRRRRQLAAQPSASDDPRYQRALEIVLEGSKQLPLAEQAASTRNRFAEGIAYLVAQGVDEKEARQQLARLVDTVLDFRRRTAGHR